MRGQDPRRQRAQQVVVVAMPATRLVADLEAIGQAFEDSHHLVDRPYLGAAGDLPRLAEHAERNAFAVDIEPDVEHDCLLRLGYVRTSTTVFHVTRLTEASFIVSHRSIEHAICAVDQTEARKPSVNGYPSSRQ